MSLLGIKNLKKRSDCKINILEVNVSETPYTRLELLKRLEAFNNFCRIWRVDTFDLLRIIENLGIADKHLFEYVTYGGPPYTLPISDNAIYTENYVYYRGGYKIEIKKYPLAITNYQYVSLYFNKIAEQIVKMRFPYLFEEPFTNKEQRFSDEIIKELPKNLNVMMCDVSHKVMSGMTIDDFIKTYTIDGYSTQLIERSKTTVYSDGNIYIELEKDHSIYLNIDFLMDKNWAGIENIKVFSIPIGNGTFYKGPQKNAPYFSHPLVKKLKDYILGT